ncbi:polysaccharide biosynthesis tyrosine autokinase [Paludisphaera rhizosphaerae]|uniref:polysaccharide biosynthesis tyrosine autokinase n=1 Tax=Paludisphaera rhizosphaerae TaxID=2711216 RepID=UPI0013E9DB06|nr:polysaccharide biosynthesis tyrosine autokinase [Paludisphaera rhizosphaerae]
MDQPEITPDNFGTEPHPATVNLPAGRSVRAGFSSHARAEDPGRPPGLSSTPDLLSLLQALRRRWVLALFAGVLLANAAGFSVWYAIPPAKYTARALLHVSTYQPKVIFDTAERRAEYHTYQRSQVTLIKSRRVLGAALSTPSVAELETVRETYDPIEWLEGELAVEFAGGSEFLQISLSGKRPKDLATLVNSVTEAYLRTVETAERTGRSERLDSLKKLYDSYMQSLEKKRRRIRALAEEVGSNDQETLALKQQYNLEMVASARRDLMSLQSELRRAQVEMALLEARDADEVPKLLTTAEIEELLAQDEQMRDHREDLASITRQLADASRSSRKGNDPIVIAFRERQRAMQKTMDARRQYLTTRAERDMRDRHEEELNHLKDRVAILKQIDQVLRADIDKMGQESQAINRGTLDLQTHQDEIVLTSEVAKKVGGEVEALEVELGAKPRITQIDRAEVPRTKDELKQLKASGIAALAAFAATLLGISFWEFQARRISTTDEVVNGLGMRLIGSLPAPPTRGRRLRSLPAEADRRWQSLLVESVDATRTMILHLARVSGIRVVMITSAQKGEGKTSLAGHLATSLARAGRRTVLVDCDLRNPSAHRLLDIPQVPGTAELLRGEANLDEVTRPVLAGELFIITAGRCDTLAVQALAQDGLQPVMDQLRGSFDFVIVDTAPVLPVVDSLLVSQHVDAVLFSILRGVSRLPLVYTACERLSVLGVRMIGAVVSGTQYDAGGPGYYDSATAEA